MSKKLRLRAWVRGGLVGVVLASALALLPASPASAIQTISWTTPPPSSAVVGQTVSFSWTGRADTFLGARITGCFVDFPDAPNYTNSFGGRFTTGNCNYVNRVVTTAPTYRIQVGFYLSTGGTMTMPWAINVGAPSPTLVNVPAANTVNLTADTALGATVPPWSVYAQDPVYGTYAASCSPEAGTVLPVGTTLGRCTATNPAGGTTSQDITITVARGTPARTWSLAATYPYGTTYGQLMTAAVSPSTLTGSWSYRDSAGVLLSPGSTIPAGANQRIHALWSPDATKAANWNGVTIDRDVSITATRQSVSFQTPASTTKPFGSAPFSVVAVGTDGGGQVSISARPGSPCTVSDASGATTVTATVTLTDVGSCVLLADQAPVAGYTAADRSSWTVAVGKGLPTLTWPSPGALTYGQSLGSILTASGSVPGAIAYALDGEPVTAAALPDAGHHTLTATLTPTDPDRFTPASTAVDLVVDPAAPGLAVAPIGDRVYGDPAVSVSATSDSPGALAFTTTTPAVCSVSERGSVTSIDSGTCSISVAQTATPNYLAATRTIRFDVAAATPVVTWAKPDALTYGTPLGTRELDASAGEVPGSFDYTPGEGTVLDAGDHTVTATFTPVESSRYAATTATVSLHVAKATPTISWPVPADITDGTALGGDQLSAEADHPGTFRYTLDDGTAPARGVKPSVGHHVLHATFVPDDADNVVGATARADLVVAPAPGTPDTLDPAVQHQVDEQRVETQADLDAGQTRTLSVSCPAGYFASDGSGRVDAVDQGTGTLADVHVLESRATALDTWTVTLANRATGRAQGKVFADCVQRETSEVDGERHALVVDQTATENRTLTGPTTVTATCADGRSPVAPGFQLDGDAVVRRSSLDTTSSWTWQVVPTGATPATTGTFSVRCLAPRVSTVDGHDHRLVLQQSATLVSVEAGQTAEMQVGCGDLARGIVGGWSLDDGLVLASAEPRAKVRAVRLYNPTSGPLTAQLSVQCLETRTEGGAGPVATPPPAPAPASTGTVSVATSSARSLTVRARGRSVTTVSCGAGATACRGTVSLVAARNQRVAGRRLPRGTVLAQGRYAVRAGAVATIVLEPTRAGRRALRAPALRQARLRIGGTVRTVTIRR